MSFAEGFVTGLANKLSENMDKRQDSARQYFERQLEIAQTTGLKNRSKVQQNVQTSLGLANKLTQMGVPKNIIMAQAASNPDSLADLYEEAEKLRLGAARDLTSEDFESAYELSGEFGDPNEDFVTFFKRIHEPMSRAMKEDPEGYQADRKGSIFGRLFRDPYELEQEKLAQTQVIDGMSAADLLAYGDGYTPNTDPNVTVTRNAEKFRDLERESSGEKSLNPTVIDSVIKQTDELLSSIFRDMKITDGKELESPEQRRVFEEDLRTKLMESPNFRFLDERNQEVALAKLDSFVRDKYSGLGVSLVKEETDDEPVEEATPAVTPDLTKPKEGEVTKDDLVKPSDKARGKKVLATTDDGSRLVMTSFRSLQVLDKDGNVLEDLYFIGQDDKGNYVYKNQAGEEETVSPLTLGIAQ